MDKPVKLLIVNSNIDLTAILSKIVSYDSNIEIVGVELGEASAYGVYKLLKARNTFVLDAVRTHMRPDITSITPVLGSLETRITHILTMLGIPIHIKGFHYARKAIAVTAENNEAVSAITKILYPHVAKIYSTTPSQVERAIRHAIEVAWDRCNTETLRTIFGYFINCEGRRPTNSEFIARIADHLQMQAFGK